MWRRIIWTACSPWGRIGAYNAPVYCTILIICWHRLHGLEQQHHMYVHAHRKTAHISRSRTAAQRGHGKSMSHCRSFVCVLIVFFCVCVYVIAYARRGPVLCGVRDINVICLLCLICVCVNMYLCRISGGIFLSHWIQFCDNLKRSLL